MKKITCMMAVLMMAFTVVMPVFSMAQGAPVASAPAVDVPAPDIPQISNNDFFEYLVKSLGGATGATTIVIISILLQVFLKFLSTPMFGEVFKKATGKVKVSTFLVLSVLANVVGLVANAGLTWQTALLHSTTISLVIAAVVGVWKQYQKAE